MAHSFCSKYMLVHHPKVGVQQWLSQIAHRIINLYSTKFPGESARGQCVNCSNCHDAGKDDILVRNLTLNTTKDIPGPHAPARIGIRTIPRSSKEEFKIELTTLATKKLYGDFSCTPTIGHPFLTMKTIEEVLKRLHYIDSEEDLVDLVNDRVPIIGTPDCKFCRWFRTSLEIYLLSIPVLLPSAISWC